MSFRKLWPWDTSAILDHFLRMSPQDRYCRFFGTVSDDVAARYVDAINWQKSVLYGYFVGSKLVGLAELVCGQSWWNRTAEIAVSVDEDQRGNGLGEMILHRALLAARNRLIDDVSLTCLYDNHAMVRLAAKNGAELHHSSEAIVAHFHSGPPSLRTLFEEHAMDGPALLGAAIAYGATLSPLTLPLIGGGARRGRTRPAKAPAPDRAA